MTGATRLALRVGGSRPTRVTVSTPTFAAECRFAVYIVFWLLFCKIYFNIITPSLQMHWVKKEPMSGLTS